MKVMSVLLLLILTVPAFAQTDEKLSPEQIAELEKVLAEFEPLTEEEKKERAIAIKEAFETGQPLVIPQSQKHQPTSTSCAGRAGLVRCMTRVANDKNAPFWKRGLVFIVALTMMLGLIYGAFRFVLLVIQGIKGLFRSEQISE